jgi:hypothetical protein
MFCLRSGTELYDVFVDVAAESITVLLLSHMLQCSITCCNVVQRAATGCGACEAVLWHDDDPQGHRSVPS